MHLHIQWILNATYTEGRKISKSLLLSLLHEIFKSRSDSSNHVCFKLHKNILSKDWILFVNNVKKPAKIWHKTLEKLHYVKTFSLHITLSRSSGSTGLTHSPLFLCKLWWGSGHGHNEVAFAAWQCLGLPLIIVLGLAVNLVYGCGAVKHCGNDASISVFFYAEDCWCSP